MKKIILILTCLPISCLAEYQGVATADAIRLGRGIISRLKSTPVDAYDYTNYDEKLGAKLVNGFSKVDADSIETNLQGTFMAVSCENPNDTNVKEFRNHIFNIQRNFYLHIIKNKNNIQVTDGLAATAFFLFYFDEPGKSILCKACTSSEHSAKYQKLMNQSQNSPESPLTDLTI